MSRKGFSVKKILDPLLIEIKHVLEKRGDKDIINLPLCRMHYESIIYLRINYEGLYLSREDKTELESLFAHKSPISLKLGKKLIEIINQSDPYEMRGNFIANYKCIYFINNFSGNENTKDYSSNTYDSYIKLLENNSIISTE